MYIESSAPTAGPRFWERWLNPRGASASVTTVGLTILFALCGWIIWKTGGTQYSYLHILYLPIVLSAAQFGLRGGLVAGLAAGLLVGPLMPLDTVRDLPQPTSSWAVRVLYFLLIGAVVGWLSGTAKDLIQSVRRRAYFDSLTRLPNQTYLKDRFESLKGYVPSGPQNRMALLVFDLHKFRNVNAAFGRRNADEVLRQAGERLDAARLRSDPDGILIRGTGARFGLLTTRAEPSQLGPMVEALNDVLSRPFFVGDVPMRLEGHAGISIWPQDGEDLDNLQRAAEIAADFASRTARPIAFYDPAQADTDEGRMHLLADLRYAIENDELVLHYQPKFDARSRRLIGVEALVRWPDGSGGLIPPGHFIPLLSGTLLEAELTRWVFRTAVRRAANWRAMGLDLTVAVNVAPGLLQRNELLEELDDLLRDHDIPIHRIELEVTEDGVFHDPEQAERTLRNLSERGFRIAIDDFGTGFSSLERLRQLPVTALKIDKLFVQNLAGDKHDQAIVEMSIAIARTLGVDSVAEGVESERDSKLLAEMGCDVLQGFHLGRPAPDLPPDCLPGMQAAD
jgi:diguanylate cyclase (GGDEF)-like protein